MLGWVAKQELGTCDTFFFVKGAQVRWRTWDLLIFVYFLSQLQHLRPLGYCAPLELVILYRSIQVQSLYFIYYLYIFETLTTVCYSIFLNV